MVGQPVYVGRPHFRVAVGAQDGGGLVIRQDEQQVDRARRGLRQLGRDQQQGSKQDPHDQNS